ncbi:F-BAR and double SH3 domains protein 1-like, partial [Diaphorina citri]|uniref:F-BAR and double SH3 domains protein 1-like n=1 Tax=Diaphorina citri TaxID=121845 RepID=A0A3Q0J4W6_DIACI
LQAARKCSEQLANIQKEVQASVQDVDKNKKLYFDEEHCAHDVRDKARDIEEKSGTDPNDPNGPDIDTKIEELKQAIRRSETGKVKAEARLECLKAGDVNVDEWLADMDMESLAVQEQDMQRSASSLSMRTDADTHGSDSMYDSDYNDATSEHANASMEKHASEEEQENTSGGAHRESTRPDSTEIDGEWAMLEQERQRIEQLTAGWDDPTQVDWGPQDGEEPAALPPEHTGPVYKCIALYSYTAQNPDELSIVENEQLEVIGDGDGDGWLRARNYKGEEGFVPHNYLDVDREESVPMDNSLHTGASSYQLTSQISFSSVDYTVDENEEPNSEVSVTTITTVKESVPPSSGHVKNLDLNKSKEIFAIALYDYEATCPEELDLTEGQVLKILRKIVHDDVDDGWWEGQIGDKVGLFPSLVVEECREDGEPLTPDDDETPPPSAPPVFTPPDVPSFLLAPQQVIITQPTPVGDRDPNDDSGFSVTISRNQQEQYETQFSEEEKEPESSVENVPSIGTFRAPPGTLDFTFQLLNQSSSSIPEPPSVASPTKATSNTVTPASNGDMGGLGVAQIVITAATPMLDDSGEKAFPPPPPPVRPSSSQDDEDLPPPPSPPQEEGETEGSSPPSVAPPGPPSVPPPAPPSHPN